MVTSRFKSRTLANKYAGIVHTHRYLVIESDDHFSHCVTKRYKSKIINSHNEISLITGKQIRYWGSVMDATRNTKWFFN